MYFSAVAQMSMFLPLTNMQKGLAARMYGVYFKLMQTAVFTFQGISDGSRASKTSNCGPYRKMTSANHLWTMLLSYYELQLPISFRAKCVRQRG